MKPNEGYVLWLFDVRMGSYLFSSSTPESFMEGVGTGRIMHVVDSSPAVDLVDSSVSIIT